jgi:hypothetical protein
MMVMMVVVVVTRFDVEMFAVHKICDVRGMTTDFYLCMCIFM